MSGKERAGLDHTGQLDRSMPPVMSWLLLKFLSTHSIYPGLVHPVVSARAPLRFR